jgi:hypothetical protein
MVNPKQDIPSDEVGILDSVPSGADTVNVTLQARTPTMELIEKISGFAKQVAASRSHVTTLTITSASSANGNATVTLPGLAPVTVALLSTDTTTAGVATKVAAASYTGWTALASGSTVAFTKTAPGFASGTATYAGGTTTSAGTFAVTTSGRSAFERYTLDPSTDNSFIIGMDGKVPANSLRTTSGRMRLIAYNAEQTDNPQLHMRTRGSDALMQPVLTARCLNSLIDPTQLVGTDIDGATDVDKNGRFDMYVI